MPKRIGRDNQNWFSKDSSILSIPVLLCLVVAALCNIFLFFGASSKEALGDANLDLPTTLSKSASNVEETRRGRSTQQQPEGVLTRSPLAKDSIPEDSPGWLRSHLQWHLDHLLQTHANLQSKATRWAIDAEEVEHTGHRKTSNTTTSITSKWKAFLGIGGTKQSGGVSNGNFPDEVDRGNNNAAATTNDIDHHLILPSSNANVQTDLWDPSVTSTPLPKWMQEYFSWHKQQLALMTKENLHSGNQKFLIMYAHINGRSGGMTDRIRYAQSC